MRFEKTNSAGYLANHLARLFGLHLARAIEPLGLAPAQFMALLELWDRDGLTQSELVDRLDIEQATLALTLKRMERDRLIIRKPNPEDKRARLIWLTDQAKALEAPAKAAASEINAKALSALAEDDREKFVETMRAAIHALKAGPQA